MKNKKAQGFVNSKVLGVIIVIVVITLVLLFLFRADINKYLRNLPGYSSTEGKASDVGEGEKIASDSCFYKIGLIGKVDVKFSFGDVRNLYIYTGSNYRIIGLFVKFGSNGNYQIIDYHGSDTQIGEIKEGVVIIKPEFLKGTTYISGSDLRKLNGAKLDSLIPRLLCKTEEQGQGNEEEEKGIQESVAKMGNSMRITLIFNSGTLSFEDYVDVQWDLEKNKLFLVNIKPNNNEDKGFEYSEKDNAWEDSEVIKHNWEYVEDKLTKDMYPEDITLIKTLFFSSTSSKMFADNVRKIILSKRAFIQGHSGYDLSLEEIEKILYGKPVKDIGDN